MHTPSNHIWRVNVWKKVCPERDLNPRPPKLVGCDHHYTTRTTMLATQPSKRWFTWSRRGPPGKLGSNPAQAGFKSRSWQTFFQTFTLEIWLLGVCIVRASLLHSLSLYIYISSTNEDKTHYKDHLYFDQLVGLRQGEWRKTVTHEVTTLSK